MSFQADFPGAIVVEARNYGYDGKPGTLNVPRAWCLHTPEEPADEVESTPAFFARTSVQASAHYYIDNDGDIYQMVPERAGAYANAVVGKPYPAWADKSKNLNLQTLSVEIEGFAGMIHQTMLRGSVQWKALVNLMAHRCQALNIPAGRTFGHYEVSNQRSDPGRLPIHELIVDVKAKMEPEEDDPMPQELYERTHKRTRFEVLAADVRQKAHELVTKGRTSSALQQIVIVRTALKVLEDDLKSAKGGRAEY